MAYMGEFNSSLAFDRPLASLLIPLIFWIVRSSGSSGQTRVLFNRRLVVARSRRVRAPVWQAALSRENQLDLDGRDPPRRDQVSRQCRTDRQSRGFGLH